MKRKELESYLESLEKFLYPKVDLEQYSTSPHIASYMLLTIDSVFDDLKNNLIADLGCGCGILSIGSALLGASYCLAVDVDSETIDIAVRNGELFDNNVIDFLTTDVRNLNSSLKRIVNGIVMNPPFGTKSNLGIDILFLKKAFLLATDFVYSLHKTSTRDYIVKKAEEWGAEVEILALLNFDIPKCYKFHRKTSVDVEVDFYRFSVQNVKQIK